MDAVQLFQMEDGAPASSSAAAPQQSAAQPQQQQQRQPDFGSAPAGIGASAPNTLDEPLWVSGSHLRVARHCAQNPFAPRCRQDSTMVILGVSDGHMVTIAKHLVLQTQACTRFQMTPAGMASQSVLR